MSRSTTSCLLRAFVAAVSLFVWPIDARAQLISGPPPTAAECTIAISTLNGGNTTGQGWERIAECGSSGINALGPKLWAARASTDTVYWGALASAARRARHTSIFGTSREVATHATSSTVAQVMSLLVLLSQHSKSSSLPFGETWATLLSVPMGNGCRLVSLTDVFQVQAGPLPSDYLARMATTTEALITSTTASQVVKDLARCIRTTIEEEYPERVATSAITLTYVCGDKFRVNNAGAFWIDVTYNVDNTTEAGDLVVAPGGNTEFVTGISGTVNLTYMGQVIRQRANGGVPCS